MQRAPTARKTWPCGFRTIPYLLTLRLGGGIAKKKRILPGPSNIDSQRSWAGGFPDYEFKSSQERQVGLHIAVLIANPNLYHVNSSGLSTSCKKGPHAHSLGC